MSHILQYSLLLGACCLLLLVFGLLKKGLLTVKYSLLWLAFAAVLVVFSLFPYVVYVIRDLLDMVMPSNLVFTLLFVFVLMLLLTVSVAISQLAEKCKRLAQANALLEKRLRKLEETLEEKPQ